MKSRYLSVSILVIFQGLFLTTAASAQLALNSWVPAQFVQAGIIQDATLNAAPIKAGDKPGGTLTINGIKMIVPDNSVIQMPANTLQWADLFNPLVSKPVYDPAIPAPLPASPTIPAGKTGLALMDNPTQVAGTSPWLPLNATVLGNIDVKNAKGYGADAYIVGLILPINQDLGNTGAGFITWIDYAKGRFEVGGTLGVPKTGTLIEINDPLGRYGIAHSPDPRWSVDSDNPTVTAGNGYPMGLPKVAPAGGKTFPAVGEVGDPDRPYYNRPLNQPLGAFGLDPFQQPNVPLITYTLPAAAAPNAAGKTTPDPWKQAPLMRGDYVIYSGVQCKLNPTLPLDPLKPMNQQTYISANTVSAVNLAIYTTPGTIPCYVHLEKMVIGTGAPSVTLPIRPNIGIQGNQTIPLLEPKNNIVIRGFCTDSTQLVDIYAVGVNPKTGAEGPRLLGTVLPSPGVGGARQAGIKGLFRFEINKGNFLPVTRAYMAISRNGTIHVPNQTGNIVPPQGGLLSGQYHAPMFTFEFVEPQPGFPVIPFNFETMPFLTQGEGGNTGFGQLNPFPPWVP